MCFLCSRLNLGGVIRSPASKGILEFPSVQALVSHEVSWSPQVLLTSKETLPRSHGLHHAATSPLLLLVHGCSLPLTSPYCWSLILPGLFPAFVEVEDPLLAQVWDLLNVQHHLECLHSNKRALSPAVTGPFSCALTFSFLEILRSPALQGSSSNPSTSRPSAAIQLTSACSMVPDSLLAAAPIPSPLGTFQLSSELGGRPSLLYSPTSLEAALHDASVRCMA